MAILEVNNLKKVYTTRLGGQKVAALADVSFSVEAGEFVAIMGGSRRVGKTTLLNILAALDKPTERRGNPGRPGMYTGSGKRKCPPFAGKIWASSFRISTCWTPSACRDNILLPLVLAGNALRPRWTPGSMPLAGSLGINAHSEQIPLREFPAGRSSAAAVARALITKPQLVLADEPTGALDSKGRPQSLLQLFEQINRERADHPDGHPLHSRRPATPGGCCSSRTARSFISLYRGGQSQRRDVSARSPTRSPCWRREGGIMTKAAVRPDWRRDNLRRNHRLYLPYLLAMRGHGGDVLYSSAPWPSDDVIGQEGLSFGAAVSEGHDGDWCTWH